MADHSFLNTVTNATTNPPNAPPIIQGKAASGVSERLKLQLQAAVATTSRSRKPVLLTAP